jgi:hypothetical protein
VNLIVYDCEIKKAIITDQPRMEGIEYAGSWGDFHLMGLSVLCYMELDSSTLALRSTGAIFESDLARFLDVIRGKRLVGFNSINFDDKLLNANNISVTTHIDVLHRIRKAGKEQAFATDKKRSYSLDFVAQANHLKKIGDGGAYAPMLWQKKRIGELVTYCMNDVLVTCEFLRLGLQGALIDPNNGNKLAFALEEGQIPDSSGYLFK